jgi:hypothetical protein
MKQKLTIEIPSGWEDVSLKKYLEMQTDMESYKDNEEAQTAVLIHHLCSLPPDYLTSISAETYNELKTELQKFVSPEEIPFQQIVKIDGVEYGFEPNLSKISYGAYADITQYESVTIDKNWAKIMSILYRPITKKVKDLYWIETYEGKIEEDKWLKVNMDVHFGALFFFVRLSMDLLNDTLNSMMQTTEIPDNIKSILARSGEVMQQSLNLPTAISKK